MEEAEVDTMTRSHQETLLMELASDSNWDGVRELLTDVSSQGENPQDVNLALALAVRSRKADFLLAIVSCSNRVCNLVKKTCTQKIGEGAGYSEAEIKWICMTLKEVGNLRMALDIAVASQCVPWDFVMNALVGAKTSNLSKKVKRAFMNKICKKSAAKFEEIAHLMCSTDPLWRRSLFLMATRHGHAAVALRLYGQGVGLGDVKFALKYALSSLSCKKLPSFLNEFKKLRCRVKIGVAVRLYKYLVKVAFSLFLVDSKTESKFLRLFDRYCQWTRASSSFIASMLTRACRAAVELNKWEWIIGCCRSMLIYCEEEEERRMEGEEAGRCNMTAKQEKAFKVYFNKKIKDLTDLKKKGQSAVRLAIEKKQYSFVHKLCVSLGEEEYFVFAIAEAFRKKAWPLLAMLTGKNTPTRSDTEKLSLSGYSYLGKKHLPRCGTGMQFLDCLKKSMGNAKVFGKAAPVLDKWIQNGEMITKGLFEKLDSKSGPSSWLRQLSAKTLAKWCSENSCCNLALFLAIAQGDMELMGRVVLKDRDSLDADLLFSSCSYLIRMQEYSSVVVLFKYLPLSILKPRGLVNELISEKRLSASQIRLLTTNLADAEQYEWAAAVLACCHQFDKAQKMLKLCKGQEAIDYVLIMAASCNSWSLVREWASERCDRVTCDRLFCLATSFFEAETVKLLTNIVDLTPHTNIPSYLSRATGTLEDSLYGSVRHLQVSKISQHLIAAGVSTFERSVQISKYTLESCPMQSAIYSGQLDLVKLYHRSGVCSNHRLFVLNNGDVLEQRKVKSSIVKYLEEAVSTPLSLQDLCRQTVSHCIGLRPCRRQRIQSLPVPKSIQGLLQFTDLLFSEEVGGAGV